MRPINPLCTLFVLLGLVGIGYAQKAILPPSFVKGTRSVWSVREDLRFNVRVVPHPDLRSLKLEVWEMAPVAWAESFPFAPEGDRAMDEPEVRYERSGRHPIRSSDEQLDYPPFLEGETIDQWRKRVSPRTLWDIWWKDGFLQAGQYEIVAGVLTSRGVRVNATMRIQVR